MRHRLTPPPSFSRMLRSLQQSQLSHPHEWRTSRWPRSSACSSAPPPTPSSRWTQLNISDYASEPITTRAHSCLLHCRLSDESVRHTTMAAQPHLSTPGPVAAPPNRMHPGITFPASYTAPSNIRRALADWCWRSQWPCCSHCSPSRRPKVIKRHRLSLQDAFISRGVASAAASPCQGSRSTWSTRRQELRSQRTRSCSTKIVVQLPC